MTCKPELFTRRKVSRQLAVLAVSAIAVSVTGSELIAGSAGAATHQGSTPTASSIVALSKKQTLTKHTVRTQVSLNDPKNKVSYTIAGKAGATNGVEDLLSGTSEAHVIVTKSSAYLSGNATGLSNFFGMPAADIKKVGTKWVSIKSTATQYASLKGSSTLPSIEKTLFPATKVLALGYKTIDNKRVYDVTWKVTKSGTTVNYAIDIPLSGSSLPVQVMESSGGATQVIKFSNWNKSFKVSVPTNTVAITTL